MSVTLDQITIRYGSQTAVDQVTAVFPEGTTGLLGPNGAGKSSLIKGLLGLVPIASGKATILGEDVIEGRKRIRRLIGYMPEDECLIPGLTGLAMVRYTGELSGMASQDAMQRSHEVLFAVGLGEARYRKVQTYSSGMKQRIKLAQAIVHDPKLLFLDEPTSGLDPRGRQEMLDLIQEIALKGTMSIVLATHILIDVERTCERVVILNQGHVMEDAKVDALRGELSNAFSIRIDGDRESFQKLLKTKGCEIQTEAKQEFDVTLPAKQSSDFLFQLAKGSGVTIRKLVPAIQTLEDVFVKRLQEDRRADL
ncbi:ABC transporter ATP-binding protein [candidate division KSB1 bacterium]|nr:ABC transporter ATP-binding protein [candidate division KSB1 bacterium]